MKRILTVSMILIMTLILSFLGSVHAEPGVFEYGVDLAFGRRVVSTPHTDGNLNVHAVDGRPETRYASQSIDDAFFYIDLGSLEKIKKVVIDWEAAYAALYAIEVSQDAVTWQEVVRVENASQTTDEIVFDHLLETRFIRFQGIRRATDWGYSFYSFEVYGPKSLNAGTDVLIVSSNEHETELNKDFMTDNLAHTRWASAVEDHQYVIFDFLEMLTYDTIKIRWEVSFARIFEIYHHPEDGSTAPSRDDEDWVMTASSDVGLGEVDTFSFAALDSRYVKLELIQRETSEQTKKTGRYPWESTFSIYSFEVFNWSTLDAVPVGHVMEFSKNAPAWPAMTNISLNPEGLLLAPSGYPIEANGVVTDMSSISDGDIPGFESYAVYNPGVIYDEEREMFHMIYRSELPDRFDRYFGDRYELGHMSTLSYASSSDGVHFTKDDNNPVVWPTLPEERGGGTEDPRIFKIEDDPNRGGLTTYYITYTMYDYQMTRQGILYTHDFITFEKVGNIAPGYGNPLKSGSFLTDPEGHAVKINDPRPGKTGMVYMIYMKDGSYTRIGFTEDVINIRPEDIVDVDTSGFGPNSIEALTKWNESCMAITNIYGKQDTNIYLMYGGTVLSNPNLQYQQPNASGWFYALGALKTTQMNPFELTNGDLDLDEPSMYPTDTNKIDYGLFEKCMFADQMIRHDGTWYLYYGAGDMYVGLATARAGVSAGAVTFTKEGTILSAETMVLNKKDGAFKETHDVTMMIEVFSNDGLLIATYQQQLDVPHFSQLEGGAYSNGLALSLSVDLGLIADLPEGYHVTATVIDTATEDVLSHPSTHVHVTSTVTSTQKGGA